MEVLEKAAKAEPEIRPGIALDFLIEQEKVQRKVLAMNSGYQDALKLNRLLGMSEDQAMRCALGHVAAIGVAYLGEVLVVAYLGEVLEKARE